MRVSAVFAETVSVVRDALAERGFELLTEIDFRATLLTKFDVDTDDYLILRACNPSYPRQALDIDRRVGQLLSCNVVVRTEDDATIVEALEWLELSADTT